MAMRLTHDEYFLAMLKATAARSTCARRSVGAIVVDFNNRIIGTGYNGVPAGMSHCIDEPCPGVGDQPGNSSRCHAVHAEINALLNCQSNIDRARCIYVSCTPCFSCAKIIANTTIRRVVCLEKYSDVMGEEVLRKKGIEVIVI